MSDSVQPHRWQPTKLRRPRDSPGKNTGVGCHFLLQCMKMKSESEVSQSFQLFATPWTIAYWAPPSMGFSRQEYWSGVPLPSPIHMYKYKYMYNYKVIVIHTYICSLATSREELTHWQRLWCWEGLEAGGEGDDRGWDGWMASLTRWMWVWVNSGSW